MHSTWVSSSRLWSLFCSLYLENFNRHHDINNAGRLHNCWRHGRGKHFRQPRGMNTRGVQEIFMSCIHRHSIQIVNTLCPIRVQLCTDLHGHCSDHPSMPFCVVHRLCRVAKHAMHLSKTAGCSTCTTSDKRNLARFFTSNTRNNSHFTIKTKDWLTKIQLCIAQQGQ